MSWKGTLITPKGGTMTTTVVAPSRKAATRIIKDMFNNYVLVDVIPVATL